MRRARVYKYRQPLKLGDTPTFHFRFTPGMKGYVWTNIVVDYTFTQNPRPVNNSGAGAFREGQKIRILPNGAGYTSFTITREESNKLQLGDYRLEVQLRNTATNSVSTVFTGDVEVVQDYVK